MASPFKMALMLLCLLYIFTISGHGITQESIGMITSLGERDVWCAYQLLNLRWARVVFRWKDIQPSPGVFDWTESDIVVRAARDLGFSLLVNLEDTPAWANGGRPPNFPPDDIEAWKTFVRAVLDRYTRFEGSSYGVKYWAMWNEPNLPIFFHGTLRDYVDRIFNPAADIVHSVGRGNMVVGPEFSWHWVLKPEQWNLYDFMAGSAGERLDVLSLHVWNDAPNGFEGYLDQVVRPLLMDTGWEGRPFWVTETGYPTCGGTCEDDAQAHFMLRVVTAQKRRSSWFQRAFLFAFFLKQPCETMIFPDFSCENWHVRPAFWALVNLFNHGVVEDPDPTCHTQSACNITSPEPVLIPPGLPRPPLHSTPPNAFSCSSP